MKEYYTYEVLKPIKDYGFKLKKGDFMTSREVNFLPPMYKKYLKLLNTPILKKEKPFKVNVWEYERGWGSKIDSVEGFDSKEEADKFIEKFNSKNTEEVTPDWYMVAKPANY